MFVHPASVTLRVAPDHLDNEVEHHQHLLGASLNSQPRSLRSQPAHQQQEDRKRDISILREEGEKALGRGTTPAGASTSVYFSHHHLSSSTTSSQDYPSEREPRETTTSEAVQPQSQNISVVKNLIFLAKTDIEENRNYSSAQEYLEIAKGILRKRKEVFRNNPVNGINRDHRVVLTDHDILEKEEEEEEEEVLLSEWEMYKRQRNYGMCYDVLKQIETATGKKRKKGVKEVLTLKYNIASVCLRIGKFEEGVVYCTAALRGRQAVFGVKDNRTYESVALMATLLDSLGQHGMAEEQRRSLPPRYLEEFLVLDDRDGRSPEDLLTTLAPESSVSLATIIPVNTETDADADADAEEGARLPRYSQISSTTCIIPPSTTTTAQTPAVIATQSTFSIASTLRPPTLLSTTTTTPEISLTAFSELCDNIDNLRSSGRCLYAGQLGTTYLKSITSNHKWSYWEAWDLIQSHITQYGMSSSTAHGRSPLHILTYCDFYDLVKILIERGANVNGKAKGGKTALHIAASSSSAGEGGDGRICGLLVDSGARIDDVDKCGWSALHHAAYHGMVGCVRVLIEKGADLEVVNDRGQTAAHIARSLRKKEIAWLLDPVKGGKKAWYSL